jgi:hypothetical protein
MLTPGTATASSPRARLSQLHALTTHNPEVTPSNIKQIYEHTQIAAPNSRNAHRI